MQTEPLWRTVLNWGVVVIFFGFPITLFILHLWSPTFRLHMQEFGYLRPWFHNVALLAFGLAGLNTVTQVRANGKGEKK